MRASRWTTVLAVAGVVLGGLGVPAAAQQGQGLVWGPCPDVPEPTLGLECSRLEVPLDYARPGVERIEIAVSRLPSTRPSQRRGVLVVNPGGQPATALGYPLELVARGLPDSVRERYDIVAFDPRGIGHSTRVACDLPPEFFIPPAYARDESDVDQWAEVSRRTARACGSAPSAPLMPHITTANVARDVDRIRVALGEERISYLGYSYGTYLGAVSATLFPNRMDRVVLDSATGPRGMDRNWSRGFALGMELRFPDFGRWAAQRHDTYGWGRTPQQVRGKYFELAERLDRAPVNGVNGAVFRGLTFALVFDDASFPFLAGFWQAVEQGTVQPQPLPPGFDFSGLLHLVCNDSEWPEDVAVYKRAVARDRVLFPMLGASGANIWPCAFWPAEQAEPPVRIGDDGPSNILIVENLRDPGSPLPGALQMRRALGDRARLLTVDDGGHRVYLYDDNACADDRVTRYLVDGSRPGDSLCHG